MIGSVFANSTTRPRAAARSLRFLGVALTLLALCAGCGVKTGYNNLDRFVRWSVDDYMDLDPAQDTFFRAELKSVLYWHRTTQLPLYAKALYELDGEFADGATMEELTVFGDQADGWWKNILEATLPLGSQLLYSATDAQLDQFAVQYEKDVKKYVKPYAKLTPDERRDRWARDFQDYFEYFSGRLNADQKEMIRAQSAKFVADDQSWADYRRRYGAALMALVRERGTFVEFSRAYRDLTFNRERWYGDDYANALATNQALYRGLTLALLDSLTTAQRRDLSKNLRDLARDFEELAAEAAPVAPPKAACLAGC